MRAFEATGAGEAQGPPREWLRPCAEGRMSRTWHAGSKPCRAIARRADAARAGARLRGGAAVPGLSGVAFCTVAFCPEQIPQICQILQI